MPHASDHLQYSTWPRRGDPAESPETAWHRAHPLDITHAPRGHQRVPEHDEARYDPGTQTVLWRRDNVLTTCYDLTEISNDAGRAAREAVHAQYGPLNNERMEPHL